jgi:intein/homing endonuclease
MKRLLRSCIDFKGEIHPEQLVQNFQKLTQSHIEWNRPDDARVFEFLTTYFQQRLELPSVQTVDDYFEKTGDVEVTERLKDIAAAPWYIRTNFAHLIASLLEDQNRIKATALLKEAHEIVNKGLVITEGREKVRKQGVREGLIYFQQKAHDLVLSEFNARTGGDIRLDGQSVWDSYLDAKVNKDKVWGRFTGLNNIDVVSHGIKKGELWVHAAFPGELKCLAGSTTIYDHATGRRRTIRELFEAGDLPVVTALDREGATFRLLQAPASHLVENGVRDVYQLTLSSGRRITATNNHKFFTQRGWVELGSLTASDWVAVPKKMGFEGPRIFTDAEVKVVGYLLGDGTVTHQILLTAANDAIREDFKDCLKATGLSEGPADYQTPSFAEVRSEGRAPSVRVSVSQGRGNSEMVSPVWELLDTLGVYGKDAYGKTIPDAFFSLPDDQVALLLGALWSTDGSCHVGEHERTDRQTLYRRTDISYASVSEELCRGVQSLLLRLGIQSSLTRVETAYDDRPYVFHTVRVVTRESKRAFTRLIKVVGKEAQFDRLASEIFAGDDAPIPSEFVPEGVRVPFVAGNFRYASQVRGRPYMTADTARLFSGCDPVAKVLEGDLAWDRVAHIEARGQEMTYDLSVPDHHSFVADDIVTHNTTFALNWCYNLVTRYKSNILYYSLEMPYEQLRLQVYVLHSSHAKWRVMGYKPLDYRKVRDGELSLAEEAFYQLVINDFCNNPEYCQFEIRAPDRDMTIEDIKLDAELTHKQMELGLVVIDHGQLMEARKSKKSKDYVVELNSIVRDTKKFCLHFNHGEKIPTLLLFQINRQGKEEAVKNQGRYKMSALSYSNEVEKSADVITTTFLDDDHRRNGTALFCNLKNRDNPIIEPFMAKIEFFCRRIYNLDTYQGSDGQGMGVEDHQAVLDAMANV